MVNVDMNSIAPVGGVLQTIDAFVDTLNISKIEKEYDLESDKGAEPIHPKTLLKVGLYAMHNCRFSLRKMEEDTVKNLAYKWITGNEVIDHSTFGKFFSKNPTLISELFAQVVFACCENDLVDFDVLAIDSVKIRANASYKQFRTTEGIEKEEGKIADRIEKLISNAMKENEEIIQTEKKVLEARKNKLEVAKDVLRERIEKKCVNKTEAEKKTIVEKEKVNVTDPDCTIVQQANGEINPAYVFTSGVDSANDIVTTITEQEGYNDGTALMPTIQDSENNSEQKHEYVLADSGFSTLANLEKLDSENQDALIPDKRYDVEKHNQTKRGDFDKSKFKYDSDNNEYTCPAGEKLKQTSSQEKNGRVINKYENKSTCSNCPLKEQCTKSKYRSISRDSNETIREQMREKINNEDNSEKYKLRAHAAESPFGQVKYNLQCRNIKRRGKDKALMEITMYMMLHNMLKLRIYSNS